MRQPFNTRLVLGAVSILGTLVYAASFALCDSERTLAPLAAAIGVAAAVAWLGFGAMIWLAQGSRQIDLWIDTCLKTQAIGIAVLMLAAAANATFFASADRLGSYPVFPVFVVVHLGLLLVADALMGAHFLLAAERTAGVAWPRALAGWVLGLNGIFALILSLLITTKVFS